MHKLQIGVMGSATDLKYTKEIEQLAEEVGSVLKILKDKNERQGK